jgi:hypothetical protein
MSKFGARSHVVLERAIQISAFMVGCLGILLFVQRSRLLAIPKAKQQAAAQAVAIRGSISRPSRAKVTDDDWKVFHK